MATVVTDVTPGFLFCHYGPGAPYLVEWTLSSGDQVEVRGRADTASGPWVYVKYSPKFGKGPTLPCWVNPKFLQMSGNVSSLPPLYPDKAPLILYQNPAPPPPPPTEVATDRTGNLVAIAWKGYVLALGDRESEGSPRFLVEAWTCINGQFVLSPIGVGTNLKAPDHTFVQFSTQVQDDAGCSEPSHGQIYLAHKDGYVGPVAIIPWP